MMIVHWIVNLIMHQIYDGGKYETRTVRQHPTRTMIFKLQICNLNEFPLNLGTWIEFEWLPEGIKRKS